MNRIEFYAPLYKDLHFHSGFIRQLDDFHCRINVQEVIHLLKRCLFFLGIVFFDKSIAFIVERPILLFFMSEEIKSTLRIFYSKKYMLRSQSMTFGLVYLKCVVEQNHKATFERKKIGSLMKAFYFNTYSISELSQIVKKKKNHSTTDIEMIMCKWVMKTNSPKKQNVYVVCTKKNSISFCQRSMVHQYSFLST